MGNNPNPMRNNERMSRGEPYEQLFHKLPFLDPFYTRFEKDYDPEPAFNKMKEIGYVVPVVAVVGYMAFCYFGTMAMKNQKAFGLTNTLAAWNLFLSLFSAYGMIRMVPSSVYMFLNMPFENTVCDPAYLRYGMGATGFAIQLFCLSKIPELIDTVFIVLRKKPLIFLHWYHHVTVLLYCWNSYITESAAGHYFASMNYTVHAVMYFYYFMQAIKAVPKWFPSWIITLMQISQMIIGTTIVGMSMYYYKYGGVHYKPGECHNEPSNLMAGGIMYGSYLYLFVEFAVKRFIFGIVEEKPKKKST